MKLQAGCWSGGSNAGQSSPQSIVESRSPGFFDAAAVHVGIPSPAGFTKFSCTLGIPCSCEQCHFAGSTPSADQVLFFGLIEGSWPCEQENILCVYRVCVYKKVTERQRSCSGNEILKLPLFKCTFLQSELNINITILC